MIDFEEIWNLPNVAGALDGKHIQTEIPANSGTLFHNYKGFFSKVFRAICDANYFFTLADIGQFSSNNNSGGLTNSSIGKQYEENRMKIPAGHVSCCSYNPLRYCLVGDEIFPLKTWLIGNFTEEQSFYN